jgi:NAD(P)-dependent dehydrogenase (short-subunit alcohol dehydrogenase family)
VANLFSFEGVRSLVVGGASGMGAATARLVAELGGEVVVMDVQDPLDPVGTFVRVDLRDRASIDAALGALGGPVGALFSCAGVADGTAGLPLINFVGQRHLVETMLTQDQLQAGGAVAMIASIGGMGWETQMPLLTELLDTPDYDGAAAWFEAHPDHSGYAFTKQAVIVYCARRSAELTRREIRINCTAPGPVMTPLMAATEGWQQFEAGLRDLTGVPGASPLQQAYPLAFLNSPAAAAINGQCFIVDGGFVAGGMSGALRSPLVDAILPHRPGGA